MMPDIVKHRTVLFRRATNQAVSGWISFRQEGHGGKHKTVAMTIHPATWHELGNPEVITIAVEVGDTLNEEDSSDEIL